MRSSMRWIAPLVAALTASAALAADITWTGGGDGTNWSDGANWGGTAPGSDDRAIFPYQPAGLATTVDAITTVQYVRIEQSTTSVSNAISLAAELVMSSNNTESSGLQYAATITDPAMIQWDINGNFLRFSSSSNGAITNNLYGTFTLDTSGSRIGTARYAGTATNDTDTFNFGSESDLAAVNVTANATIGRITTGSSTANAQRLTTVNIGTGSTVSISNDARLDFLYRGRTDGSVTLLAVNNYGTTTVNSGSTMGVVFQQVNNSNRTVDIGYHNQATGTLNHEGTLAMSLHERGTATINNSGTWKAGGGAIITGTKAGRKWRLWYRIVQQLVRRGLAEQRFDWRTGLQSADGQHVSKPDADDRESGRDLPRQRAQWVGHIERRHVHDD